jgi:hypothetical protein
VLQEVANCGFGDKFCLVSFLVELTLVAKLLAL